MNDPNLKSVVGRRSIGAIVKRHREGSIQPVMQLFLILDDGTYSEVYSRTGGMGLSMQWPGGADARVPIYRPRTTSSTRPTLPRPLKTKVSEATQDPVAGSCRPFAAPAIWLGYRPLTRAR